MLNNPATRGFTLVEVLIALALMLAGLAGAGIVLGQSVQYERESSNRRTAVRLAGSLAEELRALDRDTAESIAADSPALLAWSAAVTAALPVGTVASVTVESATPARYLVKIEWPVVGVGIQHLVLPVTT